MKTIPLYRYTRADGGTTVSTIKPETECTELTRLIADDSYILTKGTIQTSCIDTDNPDEWAEISKMSETEEKAQAYDIIIGTE